MSSVAALGRERAATRRDHASTFVASCGSPGMVRAHETTEGTSRVSVHTRASVNVRGCAQARRHSSEVVRAGHGVGKSTTRRQAARGTTLGAETTIVAAGRYPGVHKRTLHSGDERGVSDVGATRTTRQVRSGARDLFATGLKPGRCFPGTSPVPSRPPPPSTATSDFSAPSSTAPTPTAHSPHSPTPTRAMSIRPFSVFVDAGGALPNVTNTHDGALSPKSGNALKKTLTVVAGANEKENIDPLTGLSTTTHALASADRPTKKRKLVQRAASNAGPLATTAYKGRPVLARARSENAIGAAAAHSKKRKTMPTFSPVHELPEPVRASSFMASLFEDAQHADGVIAVDVAAALMAVDAAAVQVRMLRSLVPVWPCSLAPQDAAAMIVTCAAPAITADNNNNALAL